MRRPGSTYTIYLYLLPYLPLSVWYGGARSLPGGWRPCPLPHRLLVSRGVLTATAHSRESGACGGMSGPRGLVSILHRALVLYGYKRSDEYTYNICLEPCHRVDTGPQLELCQGDQSSATAQRSYAGGESIPRWPSRCLGLCGQPYGGQGLRWSHR